MPRLIVTIENDADIPQSIAKVQTAISPKSIRVEYGVRLLSALNGFKSLLGARPKKPAEALAPIPTPIEVTESNELPKIVGLTDEELVVINRGESCLRVYGKKFGDICKAELNGAFFAMKDAFSYAERHSKKYDYMQIAVQSMREYVPSSIAYLNNAFVWDSRIKSLSALQINQLVIDKKIPYAVSQWHGLEGLPPLRISTHYIKSIHENKLKLRSQYFDKAFGQRIIYAAVFTDINKAIDSAKSTPDHVANFSQVIIESEHDSTPRLPTPTVVWDSRIGYTDDRIEIKWKTERLPKIISIPLGYKTVECIECNIVGFDADHHPIFYGALHNKYFHDLQDNFAKQNDFIEHEMNRYDAEPAKYFQCIAQKPFNIHGATHPAYSVLWDSRIETKTAEPITKDIPPSYVNSLDRDNHIPIKSPCTLTIYESGIFSVEGCTGQTLDHIIRKAKTKLTDPQLTRQPYALIKSNDIVIWDSRYDDTGMFKVYVWINSTMFVYPCYSKSHAIGQLTSEISKHRNQTYGIIKNAARETIYDSRTPQLYT